MRPRLVGWAPAPFRANLPSGHIAALWLCAWTPLAPLPCSACWHMSARLSLAAPASWRRNRALYVFLRCLSPLSGLHLLFALLLPCLPFHPQRAGLRHQVCLAYMLFASVGRRVLNVFSRTFPFSPCGQCYDGHFRFGIADLVVPFVPFFSSWSYVSRSFGHTCPVKGVARPRARLVQHLLMDPLSAWLVPCLVMVSLSGWCYSRLDLRVHLELVGPRILVGCVVAPCTRPFHLFGSSISVLRQRGFGLQDHCVIVLFVGAYPETCRCAVTQRCIAPVRPRLGGWAPAISGSSSFGSHCGSWLCALAPLMSLICSACWHMSARPSLVVSAS